MTKKQFAKLLERDVSCVHCGTIDDTLTVQHRANRGMGGSKLREVPSNYVLLCSYANGLLESDWQFAVLGRKMGWKISTHLDPKSVPVFHSGFGEWRVLDDDWQFFAAHGYAVKT